MPTRPPAHRNGLQRQPQSNAKRDYDRNRRATDPALHRAKRIRSSVAWQRVQRSVLNRNPLCCDPLGHHRDAGRVEAATQVHHIRPLVTHPDLAFDRDNLAAICTGCHSQIEQRERRGQDTSGLFGAGQVCHGDQKATQGVTGGAIDSTQQGGGGVKSLPAGRPRPNCEVIKKFTRIFRGGGVAVKGGKVENLKFE